MSLFADILSSVFERRRGWLRGGAGDDRSIETLCDALVTATSETAGLTIAGQILDQFETMDDVGKLAFFHHMAQAMTLDPNALRTALDAFEQGQSKTTYRALMEAAEPARQEAIRRLNQPAAATERLVRMRADLLRLGRGNDHLMALDLDFRHLFASWFNRGFLVLRPISWDSPASILEKIIAYEAVHAIDSWEDLRRRLEPADRRCFAFFHPAMSDEPLIFVEVALTQGIPNSIQDVLADGRDPLLDTEANTAVFYSISNCQAGLASISFGNSLIKQVVADLSAELPNLKTFVTLSPIPTLGKWLDTSDLRDRAEDWTQLRELAAHYLLDEKRGRAPADPVARFHLGNGASVHAVHAGADVSPKGMTQSHGAMVNYLYDLAKIEQNHEAFATEFSIAASADVSSLAQAASQKMPVKGSTTDG